MLLPLNRYGSMTDYLPGPEEFRRLRKEHSVVPVWGEVTGDLETPVSAFLKLGREGVAFLLESAVHGDRWGRYSFVGLDPFLTMTSREGRVSFEGPAPPWSSGSGTPLEVVKATVEGYRAPALDGLPPLHGGAIGYLGYDVVRYLETLPQSTTDDVGVPELMLTFPRTLLAFDHLRQKITVVSNVVEDDGYEEAVSRIEAVVAELGSSLAYKPVTPRATEVEETASTMTREEFEEAVQRARKYIYAGDIFQVVLSHRFSVDLSADPFDVYRMLRLVNPSPYMFFLRHPEVTVLGSSPEPLVKVQGPKVVQRPIAGTRPRGVTPAEDESLEKELISDVKERAEHVMLVDLARNDVGRVCEWGSVGVDELMAVERYSHVMHLVSEVSGRLAEGRTAIDALYASFPAGTVSGAPKIRAMEIIDELEPTRRGPYAGVAGYFDFSGNIDTCIALRTGYVAGGRLYVQAGGGIVADSDPAAEWDETVSKARALMLAARMAEQMR